MIVHVAKHSVESNKDIRVAATFEEALKILREHSGRKEIVVHSGLYTGCHIKLTQQDNGLTIRAAGGEKPVLSGAVVVSDWEVDAKTGWFVGRAPKINGAFADFRFLMTVDGRWLKKARYPLTGRLTHETEFESNSWVGSHAGGWQRALSDDELNHFVYKQEDIPEDFDYTSAEIQVYHSWNESYCKLERQDRESRTFWLTPVCTYPPGSFWRSEYAVYNTKEGMGEDGRWYCDRTAGKIYYRPYPGERVEDFECFVPVTTRIIELEPSCENICIEGLTLMAATTPVINERYQHPCQRGGPGFGVMEQDGAIYGEGVNNVEIKDVEICRTGGYGIMLRGESLHVRRCRIHHCGAGGIGISSANLLTPENREEAWASCVEDCTIEEIGIDYMGAAGIFSNSAMIRRNYIANTPYTCIIANGDYCVVENNICIDPMRVLNDGACIYMHINKGCVVRGNTCFCRNETNAMVWGIYLDSDTSDFELYDNVIKGFYQPMLDARKGSRNSWHHNYMEYSGTYNGDNTMDVGFPADKRINFYGNVMHSEKIKIRSARKHFVPEEDMKDNTAICEEVYIEYRKEPGQVEPVRAEPELFGKDNVISPYVVKTAKGREDA